MTTHAGWDMVSTLGEGTKQMAYLSVKYRDQEVEKEESPRWGVIKVRVPTNG